MSCTLYLPSRFLPSLEWYVDSMLTLMERAGDSAIPDLWASVVQLVTNNPELHAYAAKRAVEALQRGAAYDVFVKCAGYLLGEYGRLLGAEGPSTLEQFQLLHSRFLAAGRDTKVRWAGVVALCGGTCFLVSFDYYVCTGTVCASGRCLTRTCCGWQVYYVGAGCPPAPLPVCRPSC